MANKVEESTRGGSRFVWEEVVLCILKIKYLRDNHMNIVNPQSGV